MQVDAYLSSVDLELGYETVLLLLMISVSLMHKFFTTRIVYWEDHIDFRITPLKVELRVNKLMSGMKKIINTAKLGYICNGYLRCLFTYYAY